MKSVRIAIELSAVILTADSRLGDSVFRSAEMGIWYSREKSFFRGVTDFHDASLHRGFFISESLILKRQLP